MARGVNGMCPLGASSLVPMRVTTSVRAALEGDAELVQGAAAERLAVAEHAEQDVLGADVRVTEAAGLLLGGDDRLTGPGGEAFEHVVIVAPLSIRCH